MGFDERNSDDAPKENNDVKKNKDANKDESARLRYPIGSSFTLRPNMLRDFKSNPGSCPTSVDSSSKPDVSKTAKSSSKPINSSIGAISSLSNSPSSNSSSTSNTNNAKGFFFADIPTGYFSLRRPFSSSSFNNSRTSTTSWNSSGSSYSSSKSVSKSPPDSSSTLLSSSSSSTLHESGDSTTDSPIRRSRPGDMSLLSTMRTMKSMSVCEGADAGKDGGVLGGVFAGIRDTMSSGGKDNCSMGNLSTTKEGSGENGSTNGFSSTQNSYVSNTHSISNSIGNSINNVAYASSKINNGNGSKIFFGVNSYSTTKSPGNVDSRPKAINSKTNQGQLSRSDTASSCSSGDSSPGATSNMFHFTPEHAHCALKAMNLLRSSKQLCDVELVAGSSSVFAHKVVLAAASPYFTAMFLSDVVERTAGKVELHEVDASALKLLVDYAYTGEIAITEDNVQVLLPASNLLQLSSVRDACCKFLMRQLHPSNCLGIRTFADAHSCEELNSKSHKYALQNFPEVCQTEEFLMLPLEKVTELISSSDLNSDCEERVFSSVTAWIKHDLSSRREHVARLLQHVRLPLLSRNFLTSHVDNEPLLHGDPDCQALQLEALKYHLLPEQRSSFTSQRTLQRKPQGFKPYIFAVGGGSLFALHSEVECYNPRTERWMPVAPMNHRRSRTAATTLGRFLYVMGGYDGITDLNFCERYNPSTNTWENITAMGTKRSCHGVGVLNGLIYCVGGYDGASCLNSVERYDPLTGIWTSCPALSCRRRHTKVAVFDQCLYAIAGFDTINYQCSVERLDPREGKWTLAPALVSRRSSMGAVGVEGVGIYCSGGTDGTVCLSSVERFNPRRCNWEPVTAMQSRRSTHELVCYDGQIFAMGGNDGSASLNSTERFDPKTNKWQLMPPMVARRSSVAVSVVECYNFEKVLLGKSP